MMNGLVCVCLGIHWAKPVIRHFRPTRARVFGREKRYPESPPHPETISPGNIAKMTGPPNPLALLNGKQEELPKVEPLGTIDLTTLNTFHCDNPDRRIISLFGKLYDVTAAEQSYGSDGAYKGTGGEINMKENVFG
jgi:hypothetical protein